MVVLSLQRGVGGSAGSGAASERPMVSAPVDSGTIDKRSGHRVMLRPCAREAAASDRYFYGRGIVPDIECSILLVQVQFAVSLEIR